MGTGVTEPTWGDYPNYDHGISGPHRSLPRPQARAAYQRLMAAKPERVDLLRRLTKLNGVDLGTDDTSVRALEEWYLGHVEGEAGELTSRWASVATDIGLFLGDLLISRSPLLRWEFFTWGARQVSYQRAVVMGHTRIPNTRYYVDPPDLVANWGLWKVRDLGDASGLFVRTLLTEAANA